MTMYCKKPTKKVSDKCQQTKERDEMKVFCRIRSLQNENDTSCIKFLSNKTLSLTPPVKSTGSQTGNYREIQCTFHHVFEEDATQETVFEHTTLPLINEVFKGRNCLLFAYGLSGSGKTYTMTGELQNTGIIPRSLDVIFNNITRLQAEKFVFKPDKMNGFEVQSEEDARKERQYELAAYMKSSRRQRYMKTDDSTEYGQQTSHCMQLESIDEDNIYAIFVSCVEIYNNVVYDLLEHNLDYGKPKLPQRKLVREDSANNMYVHDVVEVEVKSSKEAREIFYKGMHRKRTVFTLLNSNSSRSHSVFTVRVVQAVHHQFGGAAEQKEAYCVSQLCLVDLAGSERTGRTKNTGQRLMKTGDINNSLMTLKICLETLRDNQILGTKKVVPYRDSKLTYLTKNFFEGESCVHALICVNPRASEFDETIHVMRFADTVKEVQIQHFSPTVRNLGFPVGRRRPNQIFQNALQKLEQDKVHSSEGKSSLRSAFPCLELKDPMDDKLINDVTAFLEHRNEQICLLRQYWVQKEKEFHDKFEAAMKANTRAVQESTMLRGMLDFQKNKRTALEKKLKEVCSHIEQLQQELDSKNKAINKVKWELKEKKRQLLYLTLQNKQTAHICDVKLPAETHKDAYKMQFLLSKQEYKRTAKEKTKPLKKVKEILVDEINYSTSSSCVSNSSKTEHKSADVIMHATASELQNAESSDVANVVPEAQNGMESLSQPSPIAFRSRRRKCTALPVTLKEDDSTVLSDYKNIH